MSKAEFAPSYPLAKLAPADYNPRRITEDSFEELKKSLLRFGVIKPLIVNRNNGILVAGHQRTKAMKAVGIKQAPVILIANANVHDEIIFNLFHNSIETNLTEALVEGDIEPGYSFIPASRIKHAKNANPTVVTEIGRLYTKYGAWGSVVVDENGVVLANSDYAVCMKLAGEPVLVCKLDPGEADEFRRMNSIDYGEYHYDALGVKAYNQYHCQMVRLGATSKKRLNRSTLYEELVIPRIKKEDRVIDFGAGRCAYPKALNAKGYSIIPYEPHLRKGNDNKLDVAGVVKQIKALSRDIKENGLADVVILDSVLNSVTNAEFEHMVLTSCNALLRAGGTFFTHCRDIAKIDALKNASRTTQRGRSIEFLDKENFSVTFRNGVFTMQHFHTKDGLHDLLSKYFIDVEVMKLGHSTLSAICCNPKQLNPTEYRKSLDTEFNMEYPGDLRHNQHEPLVEEILKRVQDRA